MSFQAVCMNGPKLSTRKLFPGSSSDCNAKNIHRNIIYLRARNSASYEVKQNVYRYVLYTGADMCQ